MADSFGGLITSTYNDDSLLTAMTFSESLFTTMEVELGYNGANQVTERDAALRRLDSGHEHPGLYAGGAGAIDRVCEQQQHDD